MRNCPVCGVLVKDDGRCRNTSCSLYSHKVCEDLLRCQKCDCHGATKNRQNTAYEDEEMNYAILCNPCQEEQDEYWKDMWAGYWSSRL